MTTMTKNFFAVDFKGELISGHETRDEAAAACQDAARESDDDGEGYEVVEAGSVEIVEVSPEIGECTSGEYDAELARLEDCYTDREGETRYTVSVRKARDGEAPGTYLTRENGNRQILGYSIEKPEDLIELQEAAFNRFCNLDRSAK
jgi:hypothetical protein